MILQAYDFFKLFKTKNCILQIGGSDQWGNIVSGVDLIRRMLHKETFGLTSPLITLASGSKMGKTEKGAVWLNLNFFTEINTHEINEICENEKNINNLKILLANEATRILHGKLAAQKAEQTAKETFHSGGLGKDLPELKVKSKEIEKGINLFDFLSKNKITSSKSEARRVIANKGIKINDKIVEIDKKNLGKNDFKDKMLKISLGKKKHYVVKII